MLLPARTSRNLSTHLCLFCVFFIPTCLHFTNLKYPLQTLSPVSLSGLTPKPELEAATEGALVSSPVTTQIVAVADPSRDNFIALSSQVEIPSFEPSAIQSMCSESMWPNDLVFECTGARGGLNNVKQQILTCVRWAIEFRAALVLPTIRPRLETNSSESVVHEYTAPIDLGIMFDRKRFTDRLREACPQLVIYQNVSSIANPKNIKEAGNIDLIASATSEEILAFKANWTRDNKAEDGKIRLATVGRRANLFQVCNDGAEFGDSFGQVLSLREDAHRLAAAVVYELSNKYSLGMDAQTGINAHGFLGIHLRTATDAVKYHFMSYEQQAAMYQQLAIQQALPVIYVASGNRSSIEIFAAAVAPTPVVTKASLLSGADLELLESMTWDQQAQVDHLVLLKSSKFLGMSQSTFSWAVALARRAVGQQRTCGVLEKDEVFPAEKGIALRDELSIIIGKPSKYHFSTRTWP